MWLPSNRSWTVLTVIYGRGLGTGPTSIPSSRKTTLPSLTQPHSSKLTCFKQPRSPQHIRRVVSHIILLRTKASPVRHDSMDSANVHLLHVLLHISSIVVYMYTLLVMADVPTRLACSTRPLSFSRHPKLSFYS